MNAAVAGVVFVFGMVGAMFLFGGVIAALVALWIWMIIDCAKRKFKNDNEQVVWILILVFTGWLGAIIYYFAVKKQDKKKK